MTVLYDHQIFTWEKYGGISRYFSNIIEHFNSNDLSINISVLLSNNYYLSNNNYSKHHMFLPNFNFKGKALINKTINKLFSLKNLNDNKFDIFHPTYYDSYFLKYLKGKPFVLTVHDLIHELFSFEFPSDDPTLSFKEKVIPKASSIIAVSENTKRDIIKYYNYPESKIHVIYHGCSKHVISENIPFLDKYFLYVGKRNEKYKNFEVLLNAFSKFTAFNKDFKLYCVGDSLSIAECDLLRKLKISEKVISKKVTDIELNRLYKNAVAFIYPSKYEGFGLPILEAFSNDCPVLLSNSSCFPEVAIDGALYFNPVDVDSIVEALNIISNDENIRHNLIGKGRQRLMNFNWDVSAQKTNLVYQSLKL